MSGIVFALLTTLCFGLIGVIDKIGVTTTGNPLIFSMQSTLTAFIIITVVAGIYFKTSFNKHLIHITQRTWVYTILVGICSAGIFAILRFIALNESTGTFASLSQIITSSLTAILAWYFLKEKLTRPFWLLFLIIIIATYFVSIGHIALATIKQGDMFIIIGTLFLASGNIFSKLATKQVHPIILAVVRFFVGGMVILIANELIFHKNFFSQPFTIWALVSGVLWAGNVTFFNFALARIGVTLTTAILMLGPVITLLLESTLLHYQFTSIQIVAALILIGSGILIVRFSHLASKNN